MFLLEAILGKGYYDHELPCAKYANYDCKDNRSWKGSFSILSIVQIAADSHLRYDSAILLFQSSTLCAMVRIELVSFLLGCGQVQQRAYSSYWWTDKCKQIQIFIIAGLAKVWSEILERSLPGPFVSCHPSEKTLGFIMSQLIDTHPSVVFNNFYW